MWFVSGKLWISYSPAGVRKFISLLISYQEIPTREREAVVRQGGKLTELVWKFVSPEPDDCCHPYFNICISRWMDLFCCWGWREFLSTTCSFLDMLITAFGVTDKRIHRVSQSR